LCTFIVLDKVYKPEERSRHKRTLEILQYLDENPQIEVTFTYYVITISNTFAPPPVAAIISQCYTVYFMKNKHPSLSFWNPLPLLTS